MTLNIFTDGGSRGNPGNGGAGIVFFNEETGEEIFSQAIFLGQVTNNEAEYLAFNNSVELLIENQDKYKTDFVKWYLDSKLVVEQLNKNWKIKEDRLKILANKSWDLLKQTSLPYSISHVKREKNKRADELANQAMDKMK